MVGGVNMEYVLIYLNVDEFGNIENNYLAGSRVIPEQQYDYFYFIQDRTSIDIENLVENYKVENEQLVLK